MSDSPTNDIKIGEVTHHWAENNHLACSYFKTLDSTNDIAKEEAFQEDSLEKALCLYLTDNQTQGRGRGNNLWSQGQPGGALLSSWSYLAHGKPQPTTSCLVGLAVYKACVATWPFLAWSLKAPNDIYIGSKKVAGLLIENVTQADEVRLIIGLGFNVFTKPKDVSQATSLAENLPTGAPLLGKDFLSFLDRLLFEFTDAVAHCEEPLNTTDQLALLMALNAFPGLKEKYTEVTAEGSLLTASGKIHWSSL
jgi:BirA family biotin operon repressor/biotin-[acetyl-CoA-carboxylase] ligase